MMIAIRLFLAVAAVQMFSINAVAEDELSKPPELEAPTGLSAYKDLDLTLSNARQTIEILASAKFDDADHTTCLEHGAAVRGMQLWFVGYNLLASKQELGWFRSEGALGLDEIPRRRITRFGRSVVLSWWRGDGFEKLTELRTFLHAMPQELRSDLASFVSVLLEFREHTDNVLDRSHVELVKLIRRQTGEYFHHWLWWKDVFYDEKVRNTFRDGKGLAYSDFSEELRLLINSTLDPNRAPLGKCFGEAPSYRLQLGAIAGQEQFSILPVYPAKYMLTFWLRRRAEGSSALADYGLRYALRVLRGNSAATNTND